ncbi:LacI family repressor for deo operon, udp, cdd, tsx, nupC, and nupG [Arthrobacter sp. V4I6]|uniref:LacI family DNA-binding transcriptional regulator n=1 Tax=unclassified Arthrobacter TaxID=235627 RepID=UPI0027829895|nr:MULTISPECIES: LacI family DNA-binding transcriptional regulator [unclassified Arthrobacter]MDQ0820782.1 LacI family repressor for deo operon, udp, cdd, tsx, nupC, and nupG [Arthrobacter sp. V1I7]MDQ0855044.1 LacI family repressor for deo operon, udp, cdd, tsx, nupC, and nupG [Arthrobacter sp. V4I6]
MAAQAGINRPATIHDIAALCGVAASTVSRALSTPDRVNFRTRERIEAAAAQLRYTPNSQAKALSSGRTGAVGVLVPDITNPFYFDLIRGTQLQLKAAGYTQLLVDTEESDEVEASAMEQLRKGAEGLIVAASRLSDDDLLAAAAKMPLVTVNRDVRGVPAVIIDTPTATSQALDHLVSLGHTRVAYIAGPVTSQSSTRRWAALSEAADERGVEVRKLGPFAPKTQAGAAAADAAVHSGVTACITFNDLIAIGMLQRLRERGLRVPADMSIVGCDDIFGADFCNPPLTTMTSPIEQVGRVAVSMLLAQLNPLSGGATRSRSVMPTHLTVRGSTGPATDKPAGTEIRS